MNSGSPDPGLRQRQRIGHRQRLSLELMICGLLSCHHPCPAPQSDVHGQRRIRSPAVNRITESRPESVAPPAPEPTAPAPAGTEISTTTATEPAAARPREIPEATWFEMALPEFEPALVWYRPCAPVLVVTHGAGGQAEWHCQRFHRIFGGRVTLLCPRGKRIAARDPSQGYYYPDHHTLHREVHAVIDRFEAIVSTEGASRPYAYAGYSQGATMGALAFAEDGSLFSRLLLVEGGFADWSTAHVTRFRKSGGQAVLIVCGTIACINRARASASRFTRAQIRVRIAWAKGAGHRPDGAVEEATTENLPFLLEGDPRWQGLTPPPEDGYSTGREE